MLREQPRIRLIARCLVAALGCLATVSLSGCRRGPAPRPVQAFADPGSCVQCHAAAAAGYAVSGMAHSFYAPQRDAVLAANPKDNEFYHGASGTFYTMLERDGRYFQRRWLRGFDGAPDNVEELQIDYVMGSGNHVRTYLHREQDGSLIELPAAWYAENGGHLGMNPGFDNPDPATHQTIAYDCIFCHNGYPDVPALAHRDPANAIFAGALPQGIDCQRCHGPGQRHVDAARTAGASMESIRGAILNPVRLPPGRQMEVCEQCHLETTSRRLPDRIRHFDREPFSYAATQPLEQFMTYFERAPGGVGNTHFEIVSSPYRLRQSRCFRESQGALTCERCHNPHDLRKGPAAAQYYANICMQCHAAGLPEQIAVKRHPDSNDCVSCHMPKRRTEDVVHVVMTDHLIQRRPPASPALLAQRREIEPGADAYRGEVKRYFPATAAEPDGALYDATAQVMQGSNPEQGIPMLSEQIRLGHPSRPEFAIELGDALRNSGDLSGAIAAYRQALAVDPASSRGQRSLAVALAQAGLKDEALSTLDRALKLEPGNPLLWYEKARVESQQGSQSLAIPDLRRALNLKPDLAEAQNNLGIALSLTGDTQGAEAAFRAALVINPYTAATRANLGRLFAARADWQQAAFQFRKATELDPKVAPSHSDYASVLAQLHRLPEAIREAETAINADPASPQAHEMLGELLAQSGQMQPAGMQFEQALKLDPNLDDAHFFLGLVLLQRGDRASALDHLRRAEQSSDSNTAGRAHELLQQIGPH